MELPSVDKTACGGALEEVPIICSVQNLELNVRFFPFREVSPISTPASLAGSENMLASICTLFYNFSSLNLVER